MAILPVRETPLVHLSCKVCLEDAAGSKIWKKAMWRQGQGLSGYCCVRDQTPLANEAH